MELNKELREKLGLVPLTKNGARNAVVEPRYEKKPPDYDVNQTRTDLEADRRRGG